MLERDIAVGQPAMLKNWRHGTTLRDRVGKRSSSLHATLEQLVGLSEIEERFPNDGSGVVVLSPSPWKWRSPSDEEIILVQRARTELSEWLAVGKGFLRANAPELFNDFDEQAWLLVSVVDRSEAGAGPSAKTKEGVLQYVEKALESQLETLRRAGMITARPGEDLIIPDTNALYANPALEDWEGTKPATLVLTPAVLRELDDHKTHHPQASVRKKALSLTRRIDELRRRGDLVQGVKVAGTLRFRVVPFEPSEEDALPWMRLEVSDDRILATALSIAVREPTASLVIVSLDANLRNKADIAGMTVDSPPKSRESEPARADGPARQRLPDIVLGHPSSTINLTPSLTLREGQKRQLIYLEPRYPIENKGSSSIRDVTTGVRTHDGREHEFDAYRAQLIGGGEVSWVEHVGSIPAGWLPEIHESVGADAFLYLARFTDSDRKRWEVTYEAQTRTTEWTPLPAST